MMYNLQFYFCFIISGLTSNFSKKPFLTSSTTSEPLASPTTSGQLLASPLNSKNSILKSSSEPFKNTLKCTVPESSLQKTNVIGSEFSSMSCIFKKYVYYNFVFQLI